MPEIHGPEIHGHRGARALRPENTLPGLAYALAIGVDAIEFDVTLTADDGLILAHDLAVDAVIFGGGVFDGPLVGREWRSLTLAEIATLDAGGRHPLAPYEETFVALPGTPVPTLDQVCALVGRSGVTLSVELKAHPSWPDADIRLLVSSVLAVLDAHGCAGQARMLGFDWRVLRYAAELAPDMPRVALIDPYTWADGSKWLAGLDPASYHPVTGFVAAARDAGAAFVSPWDGMTSPEVIAAAHEAGLGIIVWTINDPEVMSALIELDADGLVTDRPDLLREVFVRHGVRLPVALPYLLVADCYGLLTIRNPQTLSLIGPPPMRSVNMLCCLALLATVSAATAAVSAATAAPASAAARSAQCTLPTYTDHTPHPVLTARLNKDRTVSFSGRTCPWAFIAVFQVQGHHLRNNAEDLVCDANPNKNGDFSCTSPRRYRNGSQFGVMISGQFIVGVSAPATPAAPRTLVHHVHRLPRTGPSTGFGGLAKLVVRHHPWRLAKPARTRVARAGAGPKLTVSTTPAAANGPWTITIVVRPAGARAAHRRR